MKMTLSSTNPPAGVKHAALGFDSGASWPGDQLVGYVPYDEADVTRLQNARSLANSYDAVLGVELPLGIAAGVNLFGRQGFPILYYVDAVTDDLAVFSYSIQIGSATRYRNPSVYQLDLQLSKPFRLGSAVLVIPQFDCFNLLDSHTVLQRSGFVGSYDATRSPAYDPCCGFNEVVETLSKRVFRGGVRITF
jgi:hypothetical protein